MIAFERRIRFPDSWIRQLVAVCLIAGLSSRYVVNCLPFSQPSSFTDSSAPWTTYPTKAAGRNAQLQLQNDKRNPFSRLSEQAGTSALDNTQTLASKVAESAGGSRVTSDQNPGGYLRRLKPKLSKSDSKNPGGTGGLVYNNTQYNTVTAEGVDKEVTESPSTTDTASDTEKMADLKVSPSSNKQEQVWTALANLELDSKCFVRFYYSIFVWIPGMSTSHLCRFLTAQCKCSMC